MSARNIILSSAGASTGNPNAWDISYFYYNVAPNEGNISKIIKTNQLVVVSTPSDVYIRPDGLKMYFTSPSSDRVYEYDLVNPWSIIGGTEVTSKSVSGQSLDLEGLFFKPDGTKMYLVDASGYVFQYTLSTPWSISTASYDSVVKNIIAQESFPTAICFKTDGTKMFIVGSNGDEVNEYTLSTSWDLSTATFVQNKSISAQDTSPTGISFLDDGTKMYISGNQGDDVNEYLLSTPWDISSASFTQNYSLSSETIEPTGVFFKGDGSILFVSAAFGPSNPSFLIIQYLIGGFSLLSQETNPNGLFFKPDGTKMFIVGGTGDDVNEYSLSTAWDISTSSFVTAKSISAQETSPNDIFFKPDGTKMYIVGSSGDDVNEYSLSTPWDISTATYVQNFSVSTEDTNPTGLFFKPDGTKMYITGGTGDDVNEYSLSIAWDISTASYVQNFSVATEDIGPTSISFRSNGTIMYFIGTVGDKIYQYNLSTPWNISTASYVQSLNIIETAPQGLYFRENGEDFFIVGSGIGAVLKFSVS